MNKANSILAVLAAILLAGCFDEPLPAYKDPAAGIRVYLQDKGLANLDSCMDSFAEKEKIDYVNLDRNALESLPSPIPDLAALKWLRLNENRLSALPDLSALKSLRRIYLRDNRFTSVPETLKDLPSLTDVDLSGNPIEEIPDWLAAKEGLENLSFSRTRVTKLPADISAWRSLKSLQLGDLRFSAEEMARIRKTLANTAIVF
ncbi:MAG: leucine-rich repeat domain-containing protein [Kiritimatiellae bacterium]|nr:leucine-rich repeat domain-containing protein [Kiritimatiellia bacterium]